MPETVPAIVGAAPSRDSGPLTIVKEEIRLLILLLDLAAQGARVLAGKMSDPLRSQNLEARITAIENQIQVARQVASRL
ncbi:MAG: hypothetical protein DI543_01810 [Bradyrhizobium icense]|nr:MAG: hypothetical protein DI543_01810 [Bradyrhizobium icense]